MAISQVLPQAFTAARATPSSDDIEKPLSRSLRGTAGFVLTHYRYEKTTNDTFFLLQKYESTSKRYYIASSVKEKLWFV